MPGIWFFLPLPDRLPIPDGTTVPYTSGLGRLTHEQMDLTIAMGDADYGQAGGILGSLDMSLAFSQVRVDADPEFERALAHWHWTMEQVESDGVAEAAEPGAPPPGGRTIVEVFVPTPEGGSFEDRVDGAFDRAVRAVQDVQRAYTRITGRPVRLLTAASLPHPLPVLDGSVGPHAPEWEAHCYWPHWGSFDPTPSDEVWSEAQVDDLLDASSDTPSMMSVVDLQREATVQFRREGNFRAAAMTAGITGEVFFNLLHMWLLWEDGLTPEEAAVSFGQDGLKHTKRVVAAIPDLLGGIWREGPGVVGTYLRDTVRMRNRVAHAGYSPDSQETGAAIDALQRVMEYALERLSDHRNLPRFGRTASMLCGNHFLESRDRLTKRIRELQAADEPRWKETFERWRFHLEHSLDPLAPAAGASGPDIQLAVMSLDGETMWFAYDTATLHAARLDRDTLASLGQDVEAAMPSSELVHELDEGESARIMVEVGPQPDLSWVPAHDLLPGLGIYPQQRQA